MAYQDGHNIDSQIQEVLSLQRVRSQARIVLKAARNGELTHFTYHEDRMPEAVDYVANIISRDYGPDRYNQIPPHGRWQQFNVGNVDRIPRLMKQWTSEGCDNKEIARRMVDLLFVSVLLDAGAGDVWQFEEPGTGQKWGRSEGIALASFHMFVSGKLQAASKEAVHAVDAQGLVRLDEATMKSCFQVSAQNEMAGFASRVELLNSVGSSLQRNSRIFGPQGRPGCLVDYLLTHVEGSNELDFSLLWITLQQLLLPCWPKTRTQVEGRPVGDAWPLKVLERVTSPKTKSAISSIQPFHKLTQWLGYSIRVPFTRILNLTWLNENLSTGLAEYRNGGVFVDLGILQLKDEAQKKGKALSGQEIPQFDATSDEIVEWRAMIVVLLDDLLPLVSIKLGIDLSMSQMLEAGTFRAGRELAAKLRPKSRSSPILISGDGTLF